MRITVTAANGRTGRHVIGALQRRPERSHVVGFCRSGLTPPIAGVEVERGDLLDAAALDRAMSGSDVAIWARPGQLARSSAEQVRQVREVIEGLGLAVASPAEARATLQLRGGDQVAF